MGIRNNNHHNNDQIFEHIIVRCHLTIKCVNDCFIDETKTSTASICYFAVQTHVVLISDQQHNNTRNNTHSHMPSISKCLQRVCILKCLTRRMQTTVLLGPNDGVTRLSEGGQVQVLCKFSKRDINLHLHLLKITILLLLYIILLRIVRSNKTKYCEFV